MIVLNSLQDEGAGFAYDTNRITILHRNGDVHPYGLKTKRAVARDIVQAATAYLPVSQFV